MGRAAPKNQKKSKGKVKLEFSSGGVVYRRTPEGPKILLIKDSYGRWALPKGKVEKGESQEEAAKREIHEEVGLSQLEIKGNLGEIKYFYVLKKQLIFKSVSHFLIETGEPKLKPSWEIKEARWLTPEEALKTISYKNTKSILQKAIAKIQERIIFL